MRARACIEFEFGFSRTKVGSDRAVDCMRKRTTPTIDINCAVNASLSVGVGFLRIRLHVLHGKNIINRRSAESIHQ